MSHLKLYVAPDRVHYGHQPSAADRAAREEIRGLVIIALEVAAGMRPVRHVERQRFPPELPMHLRVWSESLTQQPATGAFLERYPMELTSLHARANGEFFGSACLDGRQHAFTGMARAGRLRSFRMLSA
ncbi:hypothetical protein [Corynebacterium sp.]|uniref:hypothetical protein n=1 Tax=Corynebacterium sp. TaxID=1720 RepID=UPI0026DC6A57|nr:hypothetical protein [Corynebacterium sp.]MDO5032101.1 hypothetical protein [Corynebacterium sp.]